MEPMHFRIVVGHQSPPHDGTADRIDKVTCPTCHSIWFLHPKLKDGFYDVNCADCGEFCDIISLLGQAFEKDQV
ncbi:hypothetical protein ES703_66771 [subsurface metagenome]